ncbi:hypothetical protein V8G54_032296 [Vigna mungo]|uniref:Uncharacterized protein n=1 Tax=Vigna mungo TaxID=3915 RepID=A0AAQ3RHR2_VIGMU
MIESISVIAVTSHNNPRVLFCVKDVFLNLGRITIYETKQLIFNVLKPFSECCSTLPSCRAFLFSIVFHEQRFSPPTITIDHHLLHSFIIYFSNFCSSFLLHVFLYLNKS